MTELQKRLVQLYANGPVDKVHELAAYQQLCRKHENDNAFDGERETIENLRVMIDDWIGKQKSYRDQIEIGLRLIQKLSKPEQKEICRELTLHSYGERWSGEQRAYFENKSLFITGASDYFLSFTNRNPNRPNLNLINRNHQFFIIDVLGQEAYDRADRSARNLVAEAIHDLLRSRRLTGFFYPEHLGDNTQIEVKLRDNCTRAFAFVQLVQEEIFRFSHQSKNWCHFEYAVAQETGADRILFVQLDEEIRKQGISHEFETWFQGFTKQDALKLRWTRWHEPAAIDENFEKVSRKLTEQIDRSIERVYSGIPN
ncbi:MAG TPA: hypothetical protein VNW71_17815 [Thermoanaerobaculia bacterium]|nr:hypothetical protein [Thermoanaerobaculia bacterium]